jgi:pimeloyl-ACP methyl ester carboxylesterase
VSRIALVVALALALATIGPATTSARAAVAEPTTASGPAVRWKDCGRGFQCGTLTVPVDYAVPDGEHVGIAVTRIRALEPEQRIGSLVFNFGGPGDDGTATLRGYVADLPRRIRDRFDLVSFDPRGTGASRSIDCVSDRATDRILASDPTPDTVAALRSFYDGTEGGVDFVQRCIDKYGTWLAHLGSRDVARDLDLLRRALHEDTLDFLGYSYGTVIGAVYAQQFPAHVGRIVLDGPIDFSAGTEGDVDEETSSFEHALDAFLHQCASDEHCAFHSDGNPRAALEALRDRFEAGLTLPAFQPDGHRGARRVGVAAFYTALVASLYDEQYGWKDLADALDGARHHDGTLMLWLADSYNGRRDDGTYDSIAESASLILCADSPDPLESFTSFSSAYHDAVERYPFLGGFSNDVPIGCDPRLPKPAPDEVLGDVRVTGAAPILVVGTTGDPATPYVGARDLVGRIDRSGLLTFVSTEHTAYTKNACIDRAVDGYLVTGVLPRAGTRCRR